jgi:hypothetical protein
VSEPVVAWRRWLVAETAEGGFRLRSLTWPCVWDPGQPVKARHPGRWRTERHPRGGAPDWQCYCGIYAYRDRTQALPWNAVPALTVVGSVALWGRVVVHSRGYRAEYAYPQQLRLAYAGARELWGVPGDRFAETTACARCHRSPCVVAGRPRGLGRDATLLPYCDSCASISHRFRTSVTLSDLERALTADYQVEVAA